MMYNNTAWWLGNTNWGYHPFIGGIILLAVWSVVWTGLALWNAAKREDKGWFLFFLIVHTAGIAELLYLIFIVKLFSTPRKPTPSHRRRAK